MACFLRFFFMILFLSNYIHGTNMDKYTSPPYVNMAGKIRSEIANKLAKRYDMKVYGIGGGMADCVNMLGIDFQIQGPLSKEKLRRILIDSVQELLKAVNSDEQIRPYLKNYPFTEKEIIITLFVKDSNGNKVYDPEIDVASSWHGEMNYNTNDRENKYVYKQKIKEDYATALKIVNEENENKLSNERMKSDSN